MKYVINSPRKNRVVDGANANRRLLTAPKQKAICKIQSSLKQMDNTFVPPNMPVSGV